MIKLKKINSLSVLTQEVEADIGELVKMVTQLTDDGGVDVVVLGNGEGKIAGAASLKALDREIKINEIIKEAAAIMGGGGGGKPNLAQGAGREGDKIGDALEFVYNTLKDKLAQKNLNGFG